MDGPTVAANITTPLFFRRPAILQVLTLRLHSTLGPSSEMLRQFDDNRVHETGSALVHAVVEENPASTQPVYASCISISRDQSEG